MANKKFRTGMALALTVSMVTGMLSTTALAAGPHVHSDACGYVEASEGRDCAHVHDETCGYAEGQDEVPCDMDCTDTDGDGIVDHSPDCAYAPAVEAQPCTHVHDETCGYAEAVAGQPCAVEEVEALIAALPDAVTEADRTAVEEARAAYDALDEVLQADVSNLSVLTAAEEALDNPEDGGQETVEIPQETCTVQYQQMSEGVTYQGSFNENDGIFDVVITIGEDASGNLVLDLSDILTSTLNGYAADYGYTSYPVLPGDSNLFDITIVNESDHQYQYKQGSFVLATANAHDYPQSQVLGYDGQLIPQQFISAVCLTPKAIYKGLFGVSSSSKVSVDMLFNLYSYLEALGYSGPDALTRYVNDNNISPDNMASSGVNGIFTVSAEKLSDLREAHPELTPYILQQDNGDGTYDIQLQWPEAELAARSYNVFYQDYWSFAFGAEEAEALNPNSNTQFTRTRGIGDYSADASLYGQTDAYLTSALEENALLCKMAWDGPGIGNGYMNYEMSFYMALELEQIDSDVTVNKVDQSGNALEGARFQLYKLDGENKLYYAVENGDVVWTADPSAAAVFEGGSFDVTLLFGTYYLTEIAAPSGYNRLTEDLAIVVDENTEAFDVTNTRQSSRSEYYRVTIRYYDTDGTEIAASFTSNRIREGRDWDLSDQLPETITVDGVTYVFDHAGGDPIEGSNIRRNQVVELYYAAEEEELTDEDTPLSPTPDEETPAPEEDLTDEAIPLDPAPETPETDETPATPDDQVELVDGETPLGDLPQTGSSRRSAVPAAVYLVTLAGGLTGCGLYLTIRRKEEHA